MSLERPKLENTDNPVGVQSEINLSLDDKVNMLLELKNREITGTTDVDDLDEQIDDLLKLLADGITGFDVLGDLDAQINKLLETANSERVPIGEDGKFPIDVSQQQDVDNGDVAKTENNDNSESDKTEDVLKNQYNSNENKQADVDNDDRSIDETDDVEKSEDELIKNCPIENGSWEGDRGNSKWTPDSEYIPKKHNPEK